MKDIIKQEDILNVLDVLYGKAIDGVSKFGKPITYLADEYVNKYTEADMAAKSFIKAQIKKCTASGFLTGLGGAITLPIAIGADITTTWYVQMRMIAGLAYIGGYDVRDDEVQTMIYACLAGVSVTTVAKKAGVKFGEKYATHMIKKIPGEIIVKINQKVGFRFLTKFGQKGAINLVDMIPGVGGVVGGGFNYAETKIIADRAYNAFIKGNLDAIGDNRQYLFDFSTNIDDDMQLIKRAASQLGIRYECEYHQGDEFVYVIATTDELDELLEVLPKEVKYSKVGKKESKALLKRFNEFGGKNIVEAEFDVEEE